MTRRRNMRGIPRLTVSFGEKDKSARAPLHRKLGFSAKEHLQAVTDYHSGIDRKTGEYLSPHLYRKRVTLTS